MDKSLLASELVRDEGLRLKPYTDSVGKTTIGVGRNLTGVGISQDEAFALLQHDIDRVDDWLDKNLPWWTLLSDSRQRVLANMTFNMGGVILSFQKFLTALKSGDYKTAAEEMLDSVWSKQVGARAVRLAQMMEQG